MEIKPKLQNFLKLFITLSFIIMGLLLILVGYPSKSFLITGAVILSISFFFWFNFRYKFLNYFFSISIFFYLILLLELLYYFVLCYQNEFTATYFNQPCAKFDTISGYRLYNKNNRVVRIIKNEVVYDNYFTPNNFGYPTKQNFSFKKNDTSLIRFLLFGDSFTAGEYLPNNMPDYLQEILNKNHNIKKFEIYSFSVDGGGLYNWHNIFFKEVVPNYEFDGIILSIYRGNLQRNYSILHMTQDGGYFNRFDSIPKDSTDFWINYFNKMEKLYEIKSDKKIDEIIKNLDKNKNQFSFKKFDLYFLKKIRDKAVSFIKKLNTNKKINSINHLAIKEDNKKFTMLNEIISYCSEHNNKVYLVSIPARSNLLKKSLRGNVSIDAEEIRYMANHFGISYFNGYDVFKHLSKKEVTNHWLKYDGHWNEKGSNRLAEELAQFLLFDNR